jgi:hypothetical protein
MRSGAAIRIVARLQMAAAASGSDYTQVLMALAEHVDDQRETVFIGLPALEFAAPFVGYRFDWRLSLGKYNALRTGHCVSARLKPCDRRKSEVPF